jgi:RNA polymerase sigma factor (sigma-70 family)
MPVRSAPGLADCIRSAVHRVTTPTDADLLAAFVRDRNPAAFEAIVRRHGPLVANVCRGVLPNPADADDAAQATFLVLSRKAAAVCGDTLPGWLFRVARRAAVEVKRLADHRRRFEAAGARAEAIVGPDLSWREAVALLHEELDRLPAKYRDPLILCYLDGRPRDEAATALRCSVDTLRGRLDRGRAKLGLRLRKRGVTLSAGLLAAAGPAVAPAGLTINLLSPSATVTAVARVIAAPARGWAVGGAAAAALVGGVVLIGMGAADPPKKIDPPAKEVTPRSDLFGDPLPDGALLRLGTVQFRLSDIHGVGYRKTGELVAFSGDRTLTVWPADLAGKPKTTVTAESDVLVYSRALSSDARFAAEVRAGGKVVIWEVVGDRLVEYFRRDAKDARHVQFSPDGAWLAVIGPRLLLCNLTAKTWADVGGPEHVHGLAFSADGKRLLAFGYPAAVIETATGRTTSEIKFSGPSWGGAFSPDEATIAAIHPGTWESPGPFLELFAVPSGEAVARRKLASGFSDWVRFDPDGKGLWTGGEDGVRQYDATGEKVVREFPGLAEKPFVISPDGKRFASHSSSAVAVWDAATMKPVRPDSLAAGHTRVLSQITVSPGGQFIATHASRNQVRVWDADTGRLQSTARAPSSQGRKVAFLPDGRSYVTVAADELTPVLRDSATGRELRQFVTPPGGRKVWETWEVRVSADGKTLFTDSEPLEQEGKAYTVSWDIATGRPTGQVEKPGYNKNPELMLTATSPDGRWRAGNGVVGPVGGPDLERLVSKNDHSTDCIVPTFSADSRLVAVPLVPITALSGGPPDGGLLIYDVERRTRVIELPTGLAQQQALSPDGRTAMAANTAEIVLWEIATGKAVRRFPRGPTRWDRGVPVAFTPDSRRLVTGHDNGTAIVWDLTGTGRSKGPAPALSAAELARLWDDLLSEDAARANVAGWELTDRPGDTVALIAARLKPAQAADPATVRGLVAKLDAKGFAAREEAEKGLRELGDAALPTLRDLAKDKLSAEQRERMDRVLAAATAPIPPAGERLREVRAIAILERAGAKDVLRKLAEGLPDARLTLEARAALKRIER